VQTGAYIASAMWRGAEEIRPGIVLQAFAPDGSHAVDISLRARPHLEPSCPHLRFIGRAERKLAKPNASRRTPPAMARATGSAAAIPLGLISFRYSPIASGPRP